MDLKPALEIALRAALAGGELLRDDFHAPGGPRGHDDKAEADLEAERLIRDALLKPFPDWGYLGEETGRHPGVAGAPLWVVDPNDGTRDYLVGRRGSAVSIGLLRERRPVLGVVFAFSYPDDDGDLFAWAEGCGPVTRNGRIVVGPPARTMSSLSVSLVSSNGDRAVEANLAAAAPGRYRPVPSIAHRLALVAAGEAAVATSIHAPGAWDYCAGHALLRGSGAMLVNENGAPVSYAEDASSASKRAFGGAEALVREMAGRSWEAALKAPRTPQVSACLAPGKALRDPGRLARAQGCLLGQVAGDSLGSLVEFETADSIRKSFPDGVRELKDGGTWRTMAGQPTDDSEMAITLARSIVARGRYDDVDALEAYRRWYQTDPFDVGQTVRAALVGYLVSQSEANGSLMRASPLGIFGHALGPHRVADLGRADSSLTHPNRVPCDATAAFVVAVAHAIAHGDGATAAHAAALAWAHGRDAAPRVVEALERATIEPPVCDGENQGWVVIALQVAFYALLHSESLEEGVVETVGRGGDTDTNGAITGALMGAVHGRKAIPPQWRSMVLSCRPHPLVARRPRPQEYWPGDVLELSELLLLAGQAPGA